MDGSPQTAGASRREFIAGVAGAAAATLASCARQGAVLPAGSEGLTGRSPGIRSLRLHAPAGEMAAMRRFYGETLGLPVRGGAGLMVTAGGTEIVFEPVADGRPYYHFAFNIPENLLAEGKEWVRARCPLIRRADGSDEYHFRAWNAHAAYFNDPAGNILEIIARHSLPNARRDGKAFSSADLLYASEIALVVDDVPGAVGEAGARLGLTPFAGSNSDGFAAVGDEHRLLIIVKRGREWNSGHGRKAEVFPLSAAVPNPRAGRLESAAHGFVVAPA